VCRTQTPTKAATVWFTKVAARMPSTIGHGRLKRAASTMASSWVLSPISLMAIAAADIRKARMRSRRATRIKTGLRSYPGRR